MSASEGTLRRIFERNGTRAAWAGVAVVVGVAFEICLALAANEPLGLKVAAAVANAIVALGVAAELWVGHRASTAQGELQRRAELSLADAVKRAAEANERAAKAELETARLNEKLAPRRFDDSRLGASVLKLRPYAGTKFRFVSYQDDAEVKGLVHQLIVILLGAGWQGLPVTGLLMAELYEGVTIQYAPSKEAEFKSAAEAMGTVLNDDGIAANAEPFAALEKGETDAIRIRVGKKPQISNLWP